MRVDEATMSEQRERGEKKLGVEIQMAECRKRKKEENGKEGHLGIAEDD